MKKVNNLLIILTLFALTPAICAADEIDDKIQKAKDSAINSSKSYTDSQLSKKLIDNKIETIVLLDTLSQNTTNDIEAAKSEAQKYTNQKLSSVSSDISNAKTAAILDGIKYTNTKIAEVDTAITDAKTDAVRTSNDYTDQKVSDAKTDAVTTSNTYTDKKVSEMNTTIDNAKNEAVSTSNRYADDKVSDIHSSIDTSRKQAIASGQMYTNSRFTELENSMNGRFNSMQQQVNKNADRANAGIASVAAMANIPYTDNTRFSMGLGAGNYRNGNAVAFGGQLRMENNVNLRTSVSWNSEDSAVYGAGVAFGF